MGQRLIISEEERSRISGMYGLVNEKANMDKQVAGPFSRKGQEVVKYYIYQIGSKFYIYMTNASHKEPTLMDGTAWDNDGKGYPNEMEAKKMIDSMLRDPHHSFIKMKPKAQMGKQTDLVNEQTRLLLPDNLKINVRKLNGDPFYTIGLDNRKVKADGDIVKVGGRQIGGDSDGMEMTLKYDCQKDTYRAFHGNGNNFDGMDITGMISDEAKEALKNLKTYCSGSSAGL